ncbi:hypothetical protein [Roseiflexus castenholzii]|jgi:hypothetical protein|uniref:Uncharacterized protein n=1 Tax=Roseiflexus castenholzii (strain DSM 13941 / HLO8) TaxID=383372 RepID=A7NKK4_ROSCS|nr:hypothetical protein [Roseiflexus castenholzii]ABU58024.1 hypothetical protein Rcas_1935 [Roseiflexus castenholzii DSM 13941]
MNDTHTRSIIRIDRELGPGIAALFPEFTMTHDEGTTVMRGTLPDQAMLHGVLTRIRDLGLTLIALARENDESERFR